MKIHYGLFGLLLAVGFATAQQTEAYYTTAQSATILNDTTVLYTVTYGFGSPTRDMYMPIRAVRDPQSLTRTDTIGYTLIDRKASSTALGTATGLVLSSATIKDGRYFIPAGHAASFTLVSVVHMPTTELASHYKLRVTSLPFTFMKDGSPFENHLNPSELVYYTTPLPHTRK